MSWAAYTKFEQQHSWLLNNRWAWHLLFWFGYVLFRFWPYYITFTYYPPVFLQYMLLSEVLFVGTTYVTIWLYKRLFAARKYGRYFLVGASTWILYLCVRTLFQVYYLQAEPRFRGNSIADILINNITVVLVSFLFISGCKYFKDGYITQQFEAAKKAQHLTAEVNNLKSQIAPHFLFNTLNNLYGLAVEKSDKLPELMLRLSELLRHSLYEADKALVPLSDEVEVLKSYIQLESLRLEDNLQLDFENRIPAINPYQVAPLIGIVFVENAFKHARLVQPLVVTISIKAWLLNGWFHLQVINNYKVGCVENKGGIGITNVRRRLALLYPNGHHELNINQDDTWFKILLRMRLAKQDADGTE
ncbi:hypothetical protein EXU57_14740 [Segetibacter sp. 3557_3]|uniref:sensor histidine kinase n=1 Tax=Segetibacter sp. 3557_3 TaxID=2547429 RepID=UPI001058D4B9|nr:histidine kinase [Segetibacter sp. 3557_3]TDH24595.1 hypothetical protein EXU57_14740 [Segetibacter sp. 3557_3]